MYNYNNNNIYIYIYIYIYNRRKKERRVDMNLRVMENKEGRKSALWSSAGLPYSLALT